MMWTFFIFNVFQEVVQQNAFLVTTSSWHILICINGTKTCSGDDVFFKRIENYPSRVKEVRGGHTLMD